MPERKSYKKNQHKPDARTYTMNEWRCRRDMGETFTCPICHDKKHMGWANTDIYVNHHLEICNVCNKYNSAEVDEYIEEYLFNLPGLHPEPDFKSSSSPEDDEYTYHEASYRFKPDRTDKKIGKREFWCSDCNQYKSYATVSCESSEYRDGKVHNFCITCKSQGKELQNFNADMKQHQHKEIKIIADEFIDMLENEKANKPESKEENTMFNATKLFGGEIGQDNSGRFKLSMMGLAIKTNDGYAVYDGERMVDVMDMIMPGMDSGIFKLPVTTVDEGDLIVQGQEVFYVRDVREDSSIEALNPLTNKIEVLMPSGNLFGFKFFIKVVSMFDGIFGNQDSDNPLSAIQPFIMMQMFSGGNGLGSLFGNSSSPKNSNGGNFMEMFMMMQLFGGGKGGNPFEAMFKGLAPAEKKKAGRKPSKSKADSANTDASDANGDK